MHTTNRLRQLASTRILHHETARTSLQGAAHIAGAAKSRHNQGAHRLTRLAHRTRVANRGGRLNAVGQQGAGHLHIQQHHVRLQQGDRAQHLVTATDLPHDLQVDLQTQQGGKSLTDELLVVSEQNTNHGNLTGNERIPARRAHWALPTTTIQGLPAPPSRARRQVPQSTAPIYSSEVSPSMLTRMRVPTPPPGFSASHCAGAGSITTLPPDAATR